MCTLLRHWTDGTKTERFKLGIEAESFAVFHTSHTCDGDKYVPSFYDFEEDAWEFYLGYGGYPGIRDFDDTAMPPVPVVNGEPLFPDTFDYTKVKGAEQLRMAI